MRFALALAFASIAIGLAFASISAHAGCVVAKPSILINPGYQYASAGQDAEIQVGVRNNDSAGCTCSVFFLAAQDEKHELKPAFAQPTLNSCPGGLSWLPLGVHVGAVSLGEHLLWVNAYDQNQPGAHENFSSAVVFVQ